MVMLKGSEGRKEQFPALGKRSLPLHRVQPHGSSAEVEQAPEPCPG